MDLKGIFTPNTIPTPQWVNKKGENEFIKMIDKLVDIGKKITSIKKHADISDDSGKNIQTQTKEETVPVAQYYDATPRPLGEIFNNRTTLSERAIYKAREIVGKQLGKLQLPTSDIYLLRTDISRYAGDGTPATGRISFQMPIMTPQGDQRTIYADVDIVLGGLMPPAYFTDGLNTKYSFDAKGINEFLRGRDFEIMQNPKITPETVYFETPGHLASRGGMGITAHGNVRVAQEPEKPVEVMPGTDLAALIHELEDTSSKIAEAKKGIEEESKKLEKAVEALPEKTKLTDLEKKISQFRKQEKEVVARISALLEHVDKKTVEFQKELWKISERVDISKTPTYTAVVGSLIEQVRDKIPTIKQTVDKLWMDLRKMTSVKELVEVPPEGEPKKWEIERKPVPVTEPTYVPPKEEKASQEGMQKKSSISDYFSAIFSALNDIDIAITNAKKELKVK